MLFPVMLQLLANSKYIPLIPFILNPVIVDPLPVLVMMKIYPGSGKLYGSLGSVV